jgi:hypothetical protein
MTRKLKLFAALFSVACVMGAASAATASAEFLSGSEETQLTAKALGTQTFAAGELEVTCSGVAFDATVGLAQPEVSATPTYTGCKLNPFGVAVNVDTNGCSYLLTKEQAHLQCPEGKQIEFTAIILGKFRKCLDVHAQTPTVSSTAYSNGTNGETGKMDVEAEMVFGGVTYETTGACESTLKEADNGSLSERITLTGDGPEGSVDVTEAEEERKFSLFVAKGKGIITGESDGKLSMSFALGTITCTLGEEGGEAESEKTELSEFEVIFTEGECSFGEAPVPIDPNGCGLAWNNEGFLKGDLFVGSVNIKCPTGKRIEVTSAGCTVTVFAQSDLESVTYTNKGKDADREITADLNLTHLSYEEHDVGNPGGCKAPGVKKSDGGWTGDRTLTAENSDFEMGPLFVKPL